MAFLALAVGLVFTVGQASAAAPEVVLEGVSEVGYQTVHVSGKVDPKGEFDAWTFELSTDGGTNWEGRLGGEFFNGETGLQEVGGTIEGLHPGQSYRVRLTATNFADPTTVSPEPNLEFTTKPVTAPTVSLDPITTKTETTAHLSGHVDPSSPGALDQAGKDAYATTWEFHCEPACPGLEPHQLEAESGNSAVTADVSGLEPNTAYKVTLTATNAGGEGTDTPQSFATDEIPPTVAVGAGTSVGPGNYVLEGTVNPRNSGITSCQFEYGATASYGHVVPCEQTPATVNKPEFVTVSLSGLTVNATYHFRLLASNGTGAPVATADATFEAHPPCPNEAIREEQKSTFLPECRAWEQVSAPFKEGFKPILQQYTDDGSRLFYISIGNFSENGLGYPLNPYIATRSGVGWTTKAVNPHGPQLAMNNTSIPVFSSDLRTGIFEATSSAAGIAVAEYFRREPGGVFDRIGPRNDPATVPPSAPGGSLITNLSPSPAASSDLSRIVVSRERLSPAPPILVEYRSGGPTEAERVDLDNDGHVISQECNGGEVFGGTSTFGARATASHALSSDGRVLFWTMDCGGDISPTGELFARIGRTTVAVSESHCNRVPSDPAGPCRTSRPDARFVGAAADGSIVYFVTTQQLADDDTDEASDLYGCEIPSGEPVPVGQFNSCKSLTDLTDSSAPAEVDGVVAVSAEGSHIYFVARGVLASNANIEGQIAVAQADNLYLWQRSPADPHGEITFLTRLEQSDSSLWQGAPFEAGQTTPDGRFLLFAVHTPVIDSGQQADTDGGAIDIYRYAAETGQFARLSTDASGSGGNQPGANAVVSLMGAGLAQPAVRTNSTISSDGESATFASPEALSPYDHNQTTDVYLWRNGKVSLLSGGVKEAPGSPVPPLGTQMTPDGQTVFFPTDLPLTSTDTDSATDIYAARVDGGFHTPAPPSTCEGEASCRAPNGPASATLSPSTGTPTSGNRSPAHPCRKGNVRKHGRCVKRRHKSHAKRHRSHRSSEKKSHPSGGSRAQRNRGGR